MISLRAVSSSQRVFYTGNSLTPLDYVGYFIDASPCDPANVAIFGWSRSHAPLCYQTETNPNFTIQGVSGLTFIGCPQIINSIPTGIAENGIPTLNCTLRSGLAKTECPLADGSMDVFNEYGSYFLCE